MFAIISIPPDTEDVMAWCSTKYQHMSYLSQFVGMAHRGTSDFKPTVAGTKAIVPTPSSSAGSSEDTFGDDLVSVIPDYDSFLKYLDDNREEWVADQDV